MNVLFAGPEYWTLKLNIAERMEIVGLLTEKYINIGSQIFGTCFHSVWIRRLTDRSPIFWAKCLNTTIGRAGIVG